MISRTFIKFLLAGMLVFFSGCKAFMHGYTWSKTENAYYLVTADEKNFGNKRLVYNKGFHKRSELSNFLNCACNQRGQPDFIYEYKSDLKRRGIRLYYASIDSVFIFEEPKKNKPQSILKESRPMDAYERATFERLQTGK